jgi:glycosyltransferase involved in cell wall biosynthesis
MAALASPDAPVGELIDRADAALSAYSCQPAEAEVWQSLADARRKLAEALSAVAAADGTAPEIARARGLVRSICASGALDPAVSAADLALAEKMASRGACGLIGAMALVPAWQWPGAPRFSLVPPWLVPDYVAWAFAAPKGFAETGHASLYPERLLAWLVDLEGFLKARKGGAAAREALATFLNHGNCIPLYFCADSLRRHYEVRARIFQAAAVRPASVSTARPRAGRRLRVGFVSRHFGPQTETYTTLPTFEKLDPERFEVVLFARHSGSSPLEAYARSRAAEFHVLPEDAGAQVDLLRSANLDVAVFGTNMTAVFNEVARIALHRVAPLQVVNNSSCATTGLPEVDLYVSGTLTEAPDSTEHFTERLGLVAGPAHYFNYEADAQKPAGAWTRTALGLPEDAVVFVTAANYFKVIPEMQQTWARILAAVPGSRLLVHPFNPNWSSSYPVKRFSAEFDRVLSANGVSPDRLVVSSVKFPSRVDVKELLRVGDIYLDTFPFGGVNSLVDPLELGLPSIVWEGETFRARMGGALLRVLGLEELIAADEPGYVALATRLALDADARATVKAKVKAAMGRSPLFLDSVAASDAFGALLETAFDELVSVGHAEFRRRRTTLRAPAPVGTDMCIREGLSLLASGAIAEAAGRARAVLGTEPANPQARHLLGLTLLRSGQPARAVDYLLGAIQHIDRNPQLWHDLAVALNETGRRPQAAQAVEASLRLDGRRVEGWLLLGELALAANNREMVRQVLGVARGLAPGDSRVAALATRADAGGPPARAAVPRDILVYTDDPHHGGVAQYNHQLMMALVRAGHRVTCVQSASDSPMVREQREAGVRHLWLGFDTGRDFARTIEDPTHAERIFGSMRPDLVIFSDCSPVSSIAARQVAMTLRIPYVVVVGFVGEYLAKNFAPKVAQLAQQYASALSVVAVSQENLDLLRAHFGLLPGHGEVIHYGRPANFFAPRSESVRARLRSEARIPADAIVCFTAARLTAVKGFGYQLLAAQKLRELRGRKIHFVWAGEGDQRPELEREIARLGLGDQVHLLGQRWDVADWNDAADIFVLPSHLEGMPLAIMEAMAKRLPVVATCVSGIPEELGDTGALLPDPAKDAAGVVRGLVETITAWADDPALRESVGAKGRARADSMFRIELMLERTMALVDAALANAAVSDPKATARLQAESARALLEKGNGAEALKAANLALASDSRCIEALAVLGDIALPQDASMAEKAYRLAASLAPNDSGLAAAVGEALLAQGKKREAGDVLRAAAKTGPGRIRLLIVTARWHRAEGRGSDAAAQLRLAAPLAASAADRIRIGHELRLCGRTLESIAHYRKAAGVDEPVPTIDPSSKPVRVAFLVQYPQGWTSIRSVWEAFWDDRRFDPFIIACPNKPPNQVEGGSDAIYTFLEENHVPFTRWDEFVLKPGFADVLFIQLPYDITRPPPLHVAELIKLVPRLAYVPYALEIGGGAENISLLTNLPLHQFAWAVFARSGRHKAAFARFCSSGDSHVVVTGHPKMDCLRSAPRIPDPDLERFVDGRRMVIWNPHYDARPDGSEWGRGYSTFLRWWRHMPQQMASRRDLAFVIRPHPLFFDTIRQRGLMAPAQLDEFLSSCVAAGNIQIDRRTSYLPVFAASSAMMSDASSFVLEYAGTGRPLLYLHNPRGPGLNSDGEFVRDYCETAQTEAEIAKFLDGVQAGADERGDARRAAFRGDFMHLPDEGAGEAIKSAVLERLKKEAGEPML